METENEMKQARNCDAVTLIEPHKCLSTKCDKTETNRNENSELYWEINLEEIDF